MRILLVSTGGVTRFFRNWPENLLARALTRRGHEVRAFAYHEPESDVWGAEEEDIDGVHVRRIQPNGWLTREFGRELGREPRPDVVHIQHLRNHFAFQAAWQMRRADVPLVVVPNGLFHDPYLVADRDRPYDSPPNWRNLISTHGRLLNRIARDGRVKRHLSNYLMHWPLHHADAVIALSRHEQMLLAEMGIASDLIPQWVDVPFIQDRAGELYEDDFSRPLILYVGQLKYRKGFDLLAHAMPRVIEKFPSATFVFAGHSPIHRRELEAIAKANGACEHLRIVERVSEEDKVRLYNTADVAVLPTRYEGFGLPLLEAMASGCPIVSTNIPVIDEIVRDGENGLLAQRDDPASLAECIIRLLDNHELRARIVANGYTTVTQFDEDELVGRIETIYQRVIRERSAA